MTKFPSCAEGQPERITDNEEPVIFLRLAFIGGSLRGDIEKNVKILADLTGIASVKGFLPMCFAEASLINKKVWEDNPEVLEAAQLLVDGIVENVAKTGGAFFVRQRDDGTYSDGTLRELRIFVAAAQHAESLGLKPEIRAYRLNKKEILELQSSRVVSAFLF